MAAFKAASNMILLQGNMAGAKTPQERPISKNIARIANAVPVTLYSRVIMNVEIVVLNCQKCKQCLKGHKSLGLVFGGVL